MAPWEPVVWGDLEEPFMAIGSYIDRHNENPKPFIWTARASDILEKVKRARCAFHKRSICMTHYTSTESPQN